MSKDLSKVKAGDFVKNGSSYGLVINTPTGLQIIFETTWGSVTDKYEYRRFEGSMCSHYRYIPIRWEASFKDAKPVFADKIEIDIRINGKQANLSDISEETLIKLRKEN